MVKGLRENMNRFPELLFFSNFTIITMIRVHFVNLNNAIKCGSRGDF